MARVSVIRYEDVYVFCNNETTRNMVVGCCIAGDGPFFNRCLKTYRCKISNAVQYSEPNDLFE